MDDNPKQSECSKFELDSRTKRKMQRKAHRTFQSELLQLLKTDIIP